VLVPTGAAPPGDVYLQACPGAGCRISVTAPQHAAAVPSAHPPGPGGPVSRDSGDDPRIAGLPCAAQRAVEPGRNLFPAGWGAGCDTLGLSRGGGCFRASIGIPATPRREPRGP